MIYSDLTKKAMQICVTAHAGQLDKAGFPYVHHPLHVAESMDDEASTCVALLHDVLEDTDVTAEDLIQASFPDEVIQALRLMMHEPDVPYMDYVREIAGNEIARKVKLADLAHNSDLSRLPEVTERDLQRVKKYSQAIDLLMGHDCE